jgi:hypothetical protein
MGAIGAGARRMGRTFMAGRTFSPHVSRTFIGMIAWTVVAIIVSPLAMASFTIGIPVAIAMTGRCAHFLAVIVARSKITVTRWTIETAISKAAVERWTGRMVLTRAVEIARLKWTGEAVAMTAPLLRTATVAIAIVAPIVGRSGETIAFEFASVRTRKAFTFELAPTSTGEAISLEAQTFRTACESFALESSAFGNMPRSLTFETATLGPAGKAVERLTIEIGSPWATIEMIAVEAVMLPNVSQFALVVAMAMVPVAIHGTGRPASLESRAARSSTAASVFHSLVNGFGECHEFVLG